MSWHQISEVLSIILYKIEIFLINTTLKKTPQKTYFGSAEPVEQEIRNIVKRAG